MPLKKFIAKQNEKKNLATDQTQKDIKLYIHNYCQGKIDQNKNEDGDEEIDEEEELKTKKGKSRKSKRKKTTGDGEGSTGVNEDCFKRFPTFEEVQRLLQSNQIDKLGANNNTVGWNKVTHPLTGQFMGIPQNQAVKSR